VHTNAVQSATPGITDHNDVQIFASANEQSEVHISINMQNPNILVASANTYPGNYNQGRYVSTNGGVTWSGSDILNINSPILYGDPSTAIDANGNIYISTMIELDNGYYITTSTNNGVSFGSFVQGITVVGGSFDKEMIAIDYIPSSPYRNNLYCAWTSFETNETVNFNRSTNGGNSFTHSITLKNGPGQGANVQTGPNGEVYVCWADYGTGINATYPVSRKWSWVCAITGWRCNIQYCASSCSLCWYPENK